MLIENKAHDGNTDDEEEDDEKDELQKECHGRMKDEGSISVG